MRCVPSTIEMKLASSPSRNSSITTRAPALPKALSASMSVIAASASASVIATITPLPAARPSALITIGAPLSRTYSSASSTCGVHRVVRGGNAVAGEEILGVGLAAFQLRGGGGRAEDAQAFGAEAIDDARDQRAFRADHGERRRLRVAPARAAHRCRSRRRRRCGTWPRSRCRRCRARPGLRRRAAIAPASTPGRVRDRRNR